MRHEKAECISGSDGLAGLAGPSWQVSRLWESAKMGGSTTCSLARLYIIAGSGSGFSWQLAGAATTLIQPLVPPKPSTFGKPSTMPRSTPPRPEIEPHHCCPWMLSPLARHVIAKHMTPLPHPSHLPCAATVHHQKHLVYAATLRIPTMTARTLPTLSTNTITGKCTDNTSCRHPRIGPL